MRDHLSTSIAVALLALSFSGCAFSFEEARLVGIRQRLAAPATESQRLECRSLDRERAWYGAGAALAGACTAGTGVPAIVDIVDDKTLRTGFQVAMAVCAVGAAGLVVLRDSTGARWVAEGCGQ